MYTDDHLLLSAGIRAIAAYSERVEPIPRRMAMDFRRAPEGVVYGEERPEIDWRRLIERALREPSDQLAAARAAVDRLLHPAWVKSPLGGPRSNIVSRLILLFSERVFTTIGRIPSPADDIDAEIAAELSILRAFCQAETLTAGYATPWVGAGHDGPPIWLDENARVAAVDEAMRHDIYRRLVGTARGSERLAASVEVVRVGAQFERVATFGAGEQLDMRIVQHPSAEADLDAVRLLTRSPIYPLCQYPIADAHQPYVEAVTMGGVRLPSLRARTPAVIEPIGSALAETWQRLRTLDRALSGKEKARYARAIRRFRDAYDRAAPEDRLIDSWIGLEALVLSDSKQELAYKAGMRIATLVGATGEEREHLFKLTKKLYAARSAVAHGASDSDLAAKADEAHDLLRRVVLAWSTPGATRDPTAMDLALLNPPGDP